MLSFHFPLSSTPNSYDQGSTNFHCDGHMPASPPLFPLYDSSFTLPICSLLWFFFSFTTSSLFLLTPLVIIGEDFILWTIVISLSLVQLPFSFLVYNLISLIFHYTYYSSTNSLILVNSRHSSHYSLFSLFLSYSFTFYFLPFLSIFSWSMYTGLTYLNLVVTICILHSWSMQYKHISSLIPWVLRF